MKDLVENRSRLSLSQKFRLGAEVIRQNGLLWTIYLGFYYVCSALADKSFAAMDARRKAKHLPGLNSASLNKLIWESWNWSAAGEEWTPSPDWKESVVNTVLRKHIPENTSILEIGPGGGRWTETLLELGTKVTAVDISEECLKVCEERFSDYDHISFVLTPGDELPGIEDESIDALWSFDVFVHINRKEVNNYAGEMFRVIRKGGIGIIHHGTVGGKNGGWRSDMTAESFIEELEGAGFTIEDQFTEWTDDGKEYQAGLYEDAITVFRKPE